MRVIIIVADGLQVAALGPYGNEWIATPNLNKLATEAVVFDQHFADVPQEGASLRVRHAFPPTADDDGDWIDSLSIHGIDCLWSADGELARNTRGHTVQILQTRTLLPPWDPPEELLAEQFEDWPFDEEPEPLLEPAPGVIDPNDDVTFERLQRAYAAAVRQFDGDVGTILEECEPGDCLIVMANRGQNLGEHGLVGDERPWLHEEIMHVPLIIRLPGGAAAGRRMSALTQPIDIGPTLLELFGLPRPEEWHGQSLLPLCRGGAGARLYVCAGDQIESISEYALQTADEKVIVPHGDSQRQPMYFVKPDDRWEVNSLRQSNLERAEALEGVLREYIAASRRPGPMIIPPLPEFIPAEPS